MKPAEDDDDWFEAIAGRPRPGTEPSTLLEATWLRAALRTWAPAERPEAAWPQDADEALIERARAEGIVGRRGWCAGCAERWRRWFGSSPRLGGAIGLAAAALGVAVVLGVWRPAHEASDPDAPPVLRGAPTADGVWLLRSAEPEALRDRIAAELAAAGLVVRRYERLGRFGLDADVTAPADKDVLDDLRRHGVQPAPDGSLRIEIEQAAP